MKPESAKLPEFLTREQADAAFGVAPRVYPQQIQFEREMADLADKMITELLAVFDDTGVDLDYSEDSLETLDALAAELWPEPLDPDAESEDVDAEAIAAVVSNWGAYVGAVILQNVGGEWAFRQDIEHASIHFPRPAVEAFPMHLMRRRLALGPQVRLSEFYERLVLGLVEA